jgi:hypothetical protein
MADDDDFLDYPKGSLAVGPGDLIDVYDINAAFTDGEKIVATLRANPAGSTGGVRSCKVSFKSSLSSAGFERDFMGYWERRKKVNLRFKLPGKVITLVGRYTEPAITSNIDNFIDFSISCIGRGRAVNA